MKIIEIIDDIKLSSGGTAFYMNSLLNFYNSKSIEVLLFTGKDNVENEIQIPKVSRRFGILNLAFYLCRNIRSNEKIVLHYNGAWSKYFLLTYKLALLFSYEIIFSPHGMLETWALNRNRIIKKGILFFLQRDLVKFRAIHVTSIVEFESLKSMIGKIGNIYLIPNCIDCEQLKFDSEDNDYILFMSRLEYKKGVEQFLSALHILQNNSISFPSVYIAGAGKADYIDRVKKQICDLGLNERVTMLGRVDGEEKMNLLCKASLFVLPTFSENFGIVIAEALYSGVPVLTTVQSSWVDLDLRGIGYSLPSNEPKLLGVYIAEHFALSKSEMQLMRKKAHEYIVENFLCENILTDFIKLFDT